MKEEHIEVEGCVQTVLPGTMFRWNSTTSARARHDLRQDAQALGPPDRGRPRENGDVALHLSKARITALEVESVHAERWR